MKGLSQITLKIYPKCQYMSDMSWKCSNRP
jgi:hypothetical protein